MTDEMETIDIPFIDRLSSDGVHAIHDASLQILSEFGLKVDHDGALELLAENGADVNEDERMVTVPPGLVEDCVEEAPPTCKLHGRGPGTTVTIGGDQPVLAPAGGPPNVKEYDGTRRPSTLDDYEDFLKLAHMEDVITSAGHEICAVRDVDQSVQHLEMMLRNLVYTDKPPMGSAYGEDRALANIEMAAIANGDPDVTRPYVATVFNSVSPRTWDTKMTGGLLEYARHEQPAILSPAVMAAASGPATLAGAMALANAEILMGIVIAQSANRGAPVLYGLPSSNVDVRYGSFAIGSPEGALFVTLAGQMARFYDVPSRAGGGLTDAKLNDDQSGTEAMFQLMMTFASGIDFVLHACGILDSYATVSREKFVLDCDRIRYLQRFREGFSLDDETFALDLIEEVEPGDHFLNQRHTLDHCKTEFLIPEIYDRDSYDNWDDDGAKSAVDLAHERVQDLLEEYKRPPIDEDVHRDLETYVEEHKEQILS